MKKNMSTILLIAGGLYLLSNRKKSVSANTVGPINGSVDKIRIVNPAIVYSGPVEKSRTTPVEHNVYSKPIERLPNIKVSKKIMELSPGANPQDELFSSVDGEILNDREFHLKKVDSIYSNNLSEYVPIGYRSSSTGFGGGGLADRWGDNNEIK